MNKYFTRKKTCNILGIHYHTLYAIANRKEIDTVKIGNRQLYDVEKYLQNKGVYKSKHKRNICYCRVSSQKQKGDLKRQIEMMKRYVS
jgi:putative resolvase